MKSYHPHIWQLRLYIIGANQKIELKVYPKNDSQADIESLYAELYTITGIDIMINIFSPEEFSKISEGKLKKFLTIRSNE